MEEKMSSVKIKIIDPDIECIKKASIYFGDISEIMEKVKYGTELSEQIKASQMKQPLFELSYDKRIIGIVTETTYNKVIEIYENNQEYYLQLYQNGVKESIGENLSNLETWFSQIREYEPKNKLDRESWLERERDKFHNGISYYCNPDARKFIKVNTSMEVEKQREINWKSCLNL